MEIIIIALLILINGFFALSEIALVSSKVSRLEQLANEGSRGAVTALRLLDNSESFLSAIQVGITLIGIVTGVYGGVSIADDIAPFFAGIELLKESAHEIALSLTVVVITFFSIVAGELVPKTIALSHPEKTATRIAVPIYYFSIAFYPVVRFLSWSTTLVNSLLGIRKRSESITEADLRHLLKTASREGVIEKEQNMMHEKVFYFAGKRARHIMTHRMEIEWVDVLKPYDVIKKTIISSKHSRLVCSRGSLDDFSGIISARDFLAADTCSANTFNFDILVEPVIVPESAEMQKVLSLFKEKQVHFCIVVNEFGGLEGIITLHDILENLIGDIPEEGEPFEPDVYVRDDNSFLVSGDASVEVLDGIFENYITDLENVDYSTVAGFVLENTDKLPQIGDKFTFRDFIIEIVDIDGKRIDKVLIRKAGS